MISYIILFSLLARRHFRNKQHVIYFLKEKFFCYFPVIINSIYLFSISEKPYGLLDTPVYHNAFDTVQA